ncbi:hypothetical protein RvY_08159 [Ramazzottius varieornatus]|uniref:RRM domain-containing protein n=1 Tax=Ramazzottius varieornatus TaxID=947166 RepID=A0A1D1VAK9_RAMVA|nr:hypothetical protein RvY_08159 [Ramazzottius varieornatus]
MEGSEGPPNKRARYNDSLQSSDNSGAGGNGYQAGGRPDLSQAHSDDRSSSYAAPAPSPVIHIRGLPDNAVEVDVVNACVQFGKVRAVVMLPKRRQALVEMETLENAIPIVKEGFLLVRGAEAQVNYSNSQKIHRAGGAADEAPRQHRVLLLSILNDRYPIDVDVIHKITSPHGNVLRIVVFRKAGVQAMVEFDTVQAAVTAKSYLNGADIYSGCCTLKIEFAKPETLSVLRNDKDTWDYTRDLGGGDRYGGGGYGGESSYSGGPPPSNYQGGYDGGRRYNSSGPPSSDYGGGGHYNEPRHGYNQGGQRPRTSDNHYDNNYPPPRHDQRGGGYGGGGGGDGYNDRRYDNRGGEGSYEEHGPGPVLMLYGLNLERMNCNRLFNLFCLYGNVLRIKFLKTKEGSAMVQMHDGHAAGLCINQLNGIHLFGSKLQVGASRQPNLNEVPNPYELPDGSPSFRDYGNSRNNRFSTAEMAAKNRIQPPTRCLHFFNAPADSNEDEVAEVFTRNDCPRPQVTIMHGKSDRSTSGFVEWETVEEAVEALILANHTEMPNKRPGHPYLFKVCFSQPGRPAAGGGPSSRPSEANYQ